MQKQFLFTRPLSMGEIIDRSFRLYRLHPRLLLLTAAAIMLPLGIISAIATGSSAIAQLGGLWDVGNIPAPSTSSDTLVTVLSYVSIAASLITTVALTYLAVKLVHGHESTAGESLRKGTRRLWRYFLMLLLQGAVAGAIGLGFVLLMLMLSAVGSGIIATFLTIIVGVVFIGAIFYLLTRWSVALPAFADQELGAREALSFSWAMTEGHFWRAFLFSIVLSLLSIIIYILPATLMFLVAIFSEQVPVMLVTLIGTIEAIGDVFWLPLYSVAYVMFYFDLRVRNQGYDLTQRIDQLEAELEPEAGLGSGLAY